MRNKRKTIKFNANDHIIVNLKEEGKNILCDYYETDNIDKFKSKNVEGFFEFQFWQFMKIFGNRSVGNMTPYAPEMFLLEDELIKNKYGVKK